eukprot:Platyproteum_vivax@DN691_c0_g1_i1.p3
MAVTMAVSLAVRWLVAPCREVIVWATPTLLTALLTVVVNPPGILAFDSIMLAIFHPLLLVALALPAPVAYLVFVHSLLKLVSLLTLLLVVSEVVPFFILVRSLERLSFPNLIFLWVSPYPMYSALI